MNDIDILMIGHFARDGVYVDGRGGIVSGGAVYYGSVALRRLGLTVAGATRLHPADFPFLEELRAEGVQVYATPLAVTPKLRNGIRWCIIHHRHPGAILLQDSTGHRPGLSSKPARGWQSKISRRTLRS